MAPNVPKKRRPVSKTVFASPKETRTTRFIQKKNFSQNDGTAERIANVPADVRGRLDPIFCQIFFPARRTDKKTMTMKSGGYEVAMTSLGANLPYGAFPRLALAYIGKAVKETGQRVITLGDAAEKDFLKAIGLTSRGAAVLPKFRQACKDLFLTSFAVTKNRLVPVKDGETEAPRDIGMHLNLCDKYFLWSDDEKVIKGNGLGAVELSEQFFGLLAGSSAVHVDLQRLASLARNPLAMDIALWLPYKRYSLASSGRKFWRISFEELQDIFNPWNENERLFDFRRRFITALNNFFLAYPEYSEFVLASEEGDYLEMYILEEQARKVIGAVNTLRAHEREQKKEKGEK